MFKKTFGFLSLFLFSVFFGTCVDAQVDPMNLPKLTEYVSDFSNVLDANTLKELNLNAQLYDQKTSNQILAVLIPNRNNRELFDIGMKIFNENMLGRADKNNGLLLLISTQEKKIRIIVGYGLESQIPDLLASRIIEEDIRPLVNNGDFAGAIRAFYERSIKEITADESQIDLSTQGDSQFFWLLGLFLGVLFALTLKKKVGRSKPSFVKYLSLIIVLILVGLVVWIGVTMLFAFFAGVIFTLTGILPGRGGFSGGGFSSGGFSGGGFSGGGGSSGGGGAGD